MMTFTRIPARDARPGALLMIENGDERLVIAIRDVVEHVGTIEFMPAEDKTPFHYGRADMLWVAQR